METKEKNFISAVVYVHNSGDQVADFLRMLIGVLGEMFANYEIIAVDDASTDESAEVIKRVSAETTSCSMSIVRMSRFHGVEMSVNAGVDLAIGDMVFEFDSVYPDYPPEMIKAAYTRLLEGYDMVSVSPDTHRNLLSGLFYKIFEHYSDIQMQTESFRVVSRRLINRVTSVNAVVPYRKVAYQASGFRSDRIIYTPAGGGKRSRGRTERRFRRKLAVDSLILYTEFGYRVARTMTITMMLISLFMIVYAVVVYLAAKPIEGWTTTVLFLSVVFFGLFAILTVIVRYLRLLVDLMFKRKYYTVGSIEKLTR